MRDIAANIARSSLLDGAQIFEDRGEGYPQLLVLHDRKGVVAVGEAFSEGHVPERLKALKSEFRALLEDFESGKKIPRHSLVLVAGYSPADLAASIAALPDTAIALGLLEGFASDLRPEMSFKVSIRGVDGDDNRTSRDEARIQLDLAQENIAKNPPGDFTVLTGPAGSGKTLVLAARARLVAEQHPDWKIQILCFNRGLVPYLRSHVEGIPNVSVQTFSSWASANGYRLNLSDCGASYRGYEKAQSAGIYKNIDLLLVDEYHDFCLAWLMLLMDSLVANHGGAMFAGDDQQRLYRDSDLLDALEAYSPAIAELNRPYRSTKQILDVVAILDPEQSIPGVVDAPEGKPVEIVWTEPELPNKAAAAAHIASRLIQNGFLPGDIGVLVTSKYMIGTITAVLNAEQIRAEPKYSSKIEPDDPAWSNSVKVMTIHSAKGLEFPAVLLVGIDEVKSPGVAADREERMKSERFARVNLVGPTRAKDLLFLLAAKENQYIKRVKENSSELEMHQWPEDYR